MPSRNLSLLRIKNSRLNDKICPPKYSSFSWINQGTATATYSDLKGIYIYAPNVGGDQWRILAKNLSYSSNYMITIGFISFLYDVDHNHCGMVLLDNSNKFVAINRKKAHLIQHMKWNSPTSWNSNYVERNINSTDVIFLRVVDNGTNRICYWSSDGINFIQYSSVARTDFVTPTKVGFGANCNNSTYPCGISVFHFEEKSL